MSIHEAFDKIEDGVRIGKPFSISWAVKGTGFGSYFFYEKDGQIHCQNECMNKDSIKKVLNMMVDNCVLDEK